MAKIIAQCIDGLEQMTIPQLFQRLHDTVVTPDNLASTRPTTLFEEGDVVREYSCQHRLTRVNVTVFPDRTEIQMLHEHSSMWIVKDCTNRYKLVFPVSSKMLSDC